MKPCAATPLPVCRLRSDSGQTVVEFGLVIPLLCILVLVFVDFGKAMNYWIDATHAASEGARLASVNIDVTQPPYNAVGASSLQQYIQKELETKELQSGSAVSICFPTGAQAAGSPAPGTEGSPVRVEIAYPYHWIPFIGGTLMIKAAATMRLEHDATNFSQVGPCT
jgi:hypothetical protein